MPTLHCRTVADQVRPTLPMFAAHSAGTETDVQAAITRLVGARSPDEHQHQTQRRYRRQFINLGHLTKEARAATAISNAAPEGMIAKRTGVNVASGIVVPYQPGS